MDIDINLYNITRLDNGIIILKPKKIIDNTKYNLEITSLDFYEACKKNASKINIYEPTNLTNQIVEILYENVKKIKTYEELFMNLEKLKLALNLEIDNKFKKPDGTNKKEQIEFCIYNLKNKINNYLKENNLKADTINKLTWGFLFVQTILNFGSLNFEESEIFFLLKLFHKYYPRIKWNYREIVLIEFYSDFDLIKECGEKFNQIIIELVKGNKNVFNGTEINFFMSKLECDKQKLPQEYFPEIQNYLYYGPDEIKSHDNYNPNYIGI